MFNNNYRFINKCRGCVVTSDSSDNLICVCLCGDKITVHFAFLHADYGHLKFLISPSIGEYKLPILLLNTYSCIIVLKTNTNYGCKNNYVHGLVCLVETYSNSLFNIR